MIAEVVAVPVGATAYIGATAYNSLWQVRNDAWSSLEEATAQLALARAQQRPVDQLTETVTETLNLLGPIERFWAFPGPHAYQKVRRLFAAGNYDRCAAMVATRRTSAPMYWPDRWPGSGRNSTCT
jgi:hypothetical protein